jgi:hypothetical protein
VDWTGVSVHLYRKDHVRTGYERRGDTELRPPRTGGSPRAGRTCRPDRTARAQRELEGRFSSSRFAGCPPDRSRIANQTSPPSAVLNSRKLLNGTTQRCSEPSQRVQCLLFTLRMLVVPPSGSIRSNSLKSIVLLWLAAFQRVWMPLAWAFRSPPESGIWMMRGDTAHNRAEAVLRKVARVCGG